MNVPTPTLLRIGTRASDLARWQAHHVAGLLRALGVATEIVLIKTRGDADQQTRFSELPGGKAIFVKEIEDALLAGTVDLAVHSLKDLPIALPAGLVLAAVPERADPRDALVAREPGQTLAALPPGARLATGSQRRAAQVRALRPDLEILPLRGNVPTRLEKIRNGAADATLLAAAGLTRLGLAEAISEVLPAERMTPPMGQGALGIESREGEWSELFAQLDHAATRAAVTMERACVARLGGGCTTPAGVLAEWEATGTYGRIQGVLAHPTGTELIRASLNIEPQAVDLAAMGTALAEALLAQASPELKRAIGMAPPTSGQSVKP